LQIADAFDLDVHTLLTALSKEPELTAIYWKVAGDGGAEHSPRKSVLGAEFFEGRRAVVPPIRKVVVPVMTYDEVDELRREILEEGGLDKPCMICHSAAGHAQVRY